MSRLFELLVKVLVASGELKRLHEEAEERANALRAEKAKAQHKTSKPWAGEKKDGGASPEAPPSKPSKKRTPKVAQVVAEQAGVSVSTAERALREHAKAEQEKPLPGHLPADHEILKKHPRPPPRKWTLEKVEAFVLEHLDDRPVAPPGLLFVTIDPAERAVGARLVEHE
jgi:hypothetical protein